MLTRKSDIAVRPRTGLVKVLASTAGYVTQQMGGGNAQTIAAALATKVTDSLSSRKCESLVNGTQTKRGVTVSWTITPATRTRTVDQTVTYTPKRGTTKTVNYRMVLQCPE